MKKHLSLLSAAFFCVATQAVAESETVIDLTLPENGDKVAVLNRFTSEIGRLEKVCQGAEESSNAEILVPMCEELGFVREPHGCYSALEKKIKREESDNEFIRSEISDEHDCNLRGARDVSTKMQAVFNQYYDDMSTKDGICVDGKQEIPIDGVTVKFTCFPA